MYCLSDWRDFANMSVRKFFQETQVSSIFIIVFALSRFCQMNSRGISSHFICSYQIKITGQSNFVPR